MTRESELIEALVRLADNLVTDFDPDHLLDRLIAETMGVLRADAAGVTIIGPDHQMHAVASSSREMEQLEIFETATEEGPSIDAYRTGKPVIEPDLLRNRDKWPSFVDRAETLSFTAGYGFPLRLRDDVVGAMNLFQLKGTAPLEGSDLTVAQGFADMATLTLLQYRQQEADHAKTEQLQEALDARTIIEQAKGILAERHQLGPADAFERLRSYCRNNNLKVRTAAQQILDGDLDLD